MIIPIFNETFLEKVRKKINKAPFYKFLIDDTNPYAVHHREQCLINIQSASNSGFFNGTLGRDLSSRLESFNKNEHLSALSECRASRFFSEIMSFKISPYPQSGHKNKNLDMKCSNNGISLMVEVKSPIEEINTMSKESKFYHRDVTKKITNLLKKANKQFDPESQNLLFLDASNLIWFDRINCLDTFIGKQAVQIIYEKTSGNLIEEKPTFIPDGSLVNPLTKKGGEMKSTGETPYTRISAILVYMEKISGLFEPETHTSIFIVHNPFTKKPLDQAIFKNFPQLVIKEIKNNYYLLDWTDLI